MIKQIPHEFLTRDTRVPPRSLFRDLAAIVREQLDYRELLFSIVRRDLAVRYKQTLLGFSWAIFVPLLNMLVFTAVFTRIIPLNLDLPYPIFVYAGLVPWTFFAAGLHSATTSLTGNIALINKVYFPREIFPLSTIVLAFVDFLLASTLFAVLMLYYRIPPSWTALLLPVVVLVQVAFATGLGLLLAMGNLYFRDVRYVTGVLVTVWMFATSVVYPVHQVRGILGTLLSLNPMTPIIDAYRALLLRGELPPLIPFAGASVIALSTLILAAVAFHRAEHRFPELV
jgi:lipopolysaccharide transport system permease protein